MLVRLAPEDLAVRRKQRAVATARDRDFRHPVAVHVASICWQHAIVPPVYDGRQVPQPQVVVEGAESFIEEEGVNPDIPAGHL